MRELVCLYPNFIPNGKRQLHTSANYWTSETIWSYHQKSESPSGDRVGTVRRLEGSEGEDNNSFLSNSKTVGVTIQYPKWTFDKDKICLHA